MILDFQQIPLNIRGAYAIIFDTGFSYIGSSKNIYKRWQSWKNLLRKGEIKRANLLKAINGCNHARFEVIEVADENTHERFIEGYHLDNSMLLGLYKNVINIRNGHYFTKSFMAKRPDPLYDKFIITKEEIGYKISFA